MTEIRQYESLIQDINSVVITFPHYCSYIIAQYCSQTRTHFHTFFCLQTFKPYCTVYFVKGKVVVRKKSLISLLTFFPEKLVDQTYGTIAPV